ncbi:vesicle-associated membrane protein-associated protein B-like isoform X2 [Paramacrobiotus metropolitanus]|nr:vesicle-associated membrane protein-associated protein B-like isoform X2 [Paramacrobiotus metropolitanus]
MPQVLVINPKHSLLFKGPSSQSATVTITLTNPSSKIVAFKVKTTAPKRYCVRPNGGVIKAGETVSVNIVYQPGDGNDAQERARHKFLVQGIFVDNDQVQLDQVWRDIPKERVMESKIRCVFEDTDEGVTEQKLPDGRKTDLEGADMDQSMQKITAAALTATHPDAATGGIDSKELELRRMAEDYRRAQDEIANLRDENRRLRENGERLRKSLQTAGSVSGLPGGIGSQQDLAANWKNDLTKLPILATIVGALVLGIIMSQILF